MGVPELQAKHAVYNTGNSSADAASMWFFENIENPAIQVPLRVKPKAKSTVAQHQADPESVMMIESMGFTSKQAKRALRKCDNNMERACDWIFSHMDELDSDE
jgi:ubiquitin carboxyl-terminal hydrolase 5/13